jgi:hypothetical protein
VQRQRQVLAPDLCALGGVERQDPARAHGHEQPPVVVGQPAVEQAAVGIDPLGLVLPAALAVTDVERADHALGVHREHETLGDHRLRQKLAGAGGAAADVGAPGELEIVLGREMMHRVTGDPARLRPVGIDHRRRQADRQIRQARVGRELALEQHHRNPLARERRLVLAAEPGIARAGGEQQDDQKQEPPGGHH